MIIRGGAFTNLDYNERLYNFNQLVQKMITPGVLPQLENEYEKYDDKNKEFVDRIRSGELVTSTEMNEIINIPHTLADGTESYYTFAETFATFCGWYTKNTIRPKNTAISDITWALDIYPKYITLHNDYIC